VPLTVLTGRSLKASTAFGESFRLDGVLFVGADFLRSDRGNQILQRKRVDDVVGGNAVLMQSLLISDRPGPGAPCRRRKRQRGARDRGQRRADEIQRRVEDLRFRHLVAGRASCRIGTLEALKLRINGGVIPGGICFSTVCDMPLTCARAALMFTVG